MPQKQNIDSGIQEKMAFNIDQVNKTTAKLIRCLSMPKKGTYLLNAQFKKIVLHECAKEVYPKTRDAALGPRCPLSEMTAEQILAIVEAMRDETKIHIEIACQFDESLLNKSKLLFIQYEQQGDDDGDVHVAKAHGA